MDGFFQGEATVQVVDMSDDANRWLLRDEWLGESRLRVLREIDAFLAEHNPAR